MGLSELLGLCIRAEDYKLKSPQGTSRVCKCWGWSAGVSSKQGNPDSHRGQISIFFQPKGTVGNQNSSEIPNRVTSMETF